MAKRSATSELTKDNWDQDEEAVEFGEFKKAPESELKARKICRGKRTLASGGTKPSGPSVFTNFTGFGASNSTNSVPSFSFGSSVVGTGAEKPALSFSFDKPTENSSSINGFKSNTVPEANKEESSMFQYVPTSNLAKPKRSIDGEKTEFPKSLFEFGSPKECKTDSATTSALNVKSKDSPSTFSFTKESSPKKLESSATANGSNTGSSSCLFGSSEGKKTEKHDDNYLADLKMLNESVFNWIKVHLDKNKFVNLSPIFEDYKSHYSKLKKSDSSNSDAEKKSTFSFGSSNKTAFSNDKSCTDLGKSTPAFSFGSSGTKVSDDTKSSGFSFSSKKDTETTGSSFSFGSKSTNSTTGFSFGSTTSAPAFSFASMPKEPSAIASATSEADTEETDEPPKNEVTEVKEDDAIYEKKVKLFYKKDNNYVDKGIGTLFLKPVGDKVQLVVRALTNLGNILLNIILNESLPTQRMGKNNVLLVCVPHPPVDSNNPKSPVSMLIRVKTAEDADDLLAKIDEHKKK